MTKNEIKNNLQAFSKNNLLQNSLDLFTTLGYTTKRQYAINSLDEFKNKFLISSFNEHKLLFSEWENGEFLFELQANDLNSEETTITSEIVDNRAIETYWFFAIELKGESYTKKQLSDITREINKQRPIPAFILFKYADKLTFSIIDRRLNKKDDNKDVLEKVILIKDINFNNPHRAHIDILSDMSFENIKNKFNVSNFVQLHLNWLKALSVSELNKRFYTELSNWFFWTMDTCQFSKNNTIKDNVMFGIRMVTRIIFDWFIKEKGLINGKIFDKQTYLDLLKTEYKGQGDLYYKVVLQNLFFGCLSKPMDRRGFRSEDRFQGKNTGYDVNNLFRYAKYLNNPQEIVNMFKDIPFLNGGLFECADDKRNGKYIDCFTDNDSRNFLKIPDDIFFLEHEKTVDLSAHFDNNKSYKKAKVRGLFPILNSYKFTIDETTPVEEEIALDPELLGRVFENLLAAHNPETKTTARKSTGSYYTPREIVDYMCEQSLIQYLKTQVENLQIENIDNKLKELLSYSETHSFFDSEVDVLINAVNNVKILDPACGSGAFPMGLLHKLVHVLSKLDPHNKKWKSSQIEKASQIDDLEAREEAINIIEKQFNDNEMDYSRKLYLIQNCIFGVDIQPIATQISRLRFFISLIVEEKPNKNKPNMGILALPNLETKFVAANTLIDLPQDNLFSTFPTIVKLREELEKVRTMYFRANTSKKKTEIQNRDNEFRLKIKQEVLTLGATFESAARLADWSPYDKDESSFWFNPKWMFNVDKFDIVIANPPYIDSETMFNVGLQDEREYITKHFEWAKGNWDIYIAFFEKGYNFLNSKGNMIFITPDKWLARPFGKTMRKNIYKNVVSILFAGRDVFESALVDSIITNISKSKVGKINIKKYDKKIIKDKRSIDLSGLKPPYTLDFISSDNLDFINKIEKQPLKLFSLCECQSACATSDAYKLKPIIKSLSNENDYNNNLFKIMNTGTIGKYYSKWATTKIKYLKDSYEFPIVNKSDFYKEFSNSYSKKVCVPKLIIKGLTLLYCYLDSKGEYIPCKSTLVIQNDDENILKVAMAIVNSNLSIAYMKEKYSSASYNGGIGFNKDMLNNFPIPKISENIKILLIDKVNKIIDVTLTNDYETNTKKQKEVSNIENEINLILYKLYALTYSEVKTIDLNFSLSELEYNNYQI